MVKKIDQFHKLKLLITKVVTLVVFVLVICSSTKVFASNTTNSQGKVSSIFNSYTNYVMKVISLPGNYIYDIFSKDNSAIVSQVENKTENKKSKSETSINSNVTTAPTVNIIPNTSTVVAPTKELPINNTKSTSSSKVIVGQTGPAGPQGPKGDKGETGQSIIADTSNFVSSLSFSRQLDGIFKSITNSVNNLSDSIKDSLTTKLLTVSGNATVGGDLTVSGNLHANVTGNITTANSLASNPTDCPLGTWATTIDASGNLTCSSIIASDVGAPSGSGTSTGTNTGDQTLFGLGGVPTSRTVNGHALSSDVLVTPTDLGLVIGTNVLAQRTFGTAANNNTGDFEVPLTFSTGLNRTGNTITSIITQYTNAMADARVVAGITGKQNTITTGTTSQYFKGDLSLGTFPTALSSFTNDLGNYGGFVTGTPWTSMGYLTSYTETDPTIYAWAKASTKPSYTANDVGLGNVTNESKATMFTNPVFTGTVGFGDIAMSGNIIPTVNNTYTLGDATHMWKDFYVGPGSIYVDGQKVLQTDLSDSVVVSADSAQNLILKTTGGGNIELNPASGGGAILAKSNITLTAGKTIRSSDLSPIIFSDGLSAPSITTSVLNGGIAITPNGTGNTYVTTGNFGIGTTTPSSKLNIADSISGTVTPILDLMTKSYVSSSNDWTTGVAIRLGGYTSTGTGTDNTASRIVSYSNPYSTNATKLQIQTHNNTAGFWNTGMFMDDTGNVGIGTTSPNSLLNIGTGTPTTAANGIQFGSDTVANFYRSSAGIIKTDGWLYGASGLIGNVVQYNTAYPIGDVDAVFQTRASTSRNIIFKSVGTTPTETMRLDTNGNVGIGTTTPGEKLEVNGNVKIGTGAVATTAKFTVRENSLINTIVGSATDDYGKLDWTANAGGAFIVSATAGKTLSLGANNHTGTTADLFINTSGNVGIGTTSPGSILDVQANVGGNIKVMNFQNNGTSGSTYFAVKNGTYEADLEQNNSSNGSFRFGSTYVDTNLANTYTGTLALGAINLVTGNIIRLSVAGGTGTLAGNVGIGTTSPTSILALGGTAARTIQMERNTTAATAGQGLTLSSGGAIAGTADLNGGDLTLKSGISTGTGSSALHFFTATAGTTGTTDRTPTEKMTILGNGNIGIGTTSPSYKLHISSGDSAVSTRYRLQAGDSWDFISGGTTADAYTSASGFTIRNADTGVNALSISSTGNVGIGTTNPTAGKLQVVGAFTGYGTAPLVVQNTNAYADPYMQYSQVWLSSTGSVLASIRNDGTFSMEGSQGQIRGRSINYSSGPTAIDISTDALTLTSKANNANIVLTPNGTGFTILNGNVGIGTTAPGQTLAVVDSGAGTFGFGTSTGLATSRTLTVGNYVDASSTYNAQAFILNGTAARKTLVVRGAASQSGSLFEWQNSAGTGLGAIDSTGSVGIGTTTPTTKLEVKGDGSGIARLYTSAGAARYYFEESAGNIWGNIPLRLHKDTAGNNYNQILTTASGNIAITASGTATGNVGIGTTTPNQQLEITKNFRLPATTYNGGNPYGIIYKDGNPFIHDFNYGNNGTVTTLGGNLFVGQNAGNFTMGSTATSTSHSSYNTGVGYSSLSANTLGYSNTAFGYYSLFANTTGDNNSAVGYASLSSNTTGYRNIANGTQTLYGNTTGNNNTAIGYGAGRYIANGSTLNTTGDYNMFIGTDTKALADNDQNEIVVGYNAIGNGSNTTTIGTGNVLYVGGASITGKVARFTNSTGYCDIDPTTTSLTCSSDINLKKNVTTLENIEFALRTIPDISNESTLEKLSYLTPVVYNWKTESNTSSKHIGFIAQEMEQIFPDLVATDANTGLKSVSYTNITPYLVSAIQEMNLKVVDLSSLDTSVSTSLGYLMKEFLGSVGNNISDLYALVIHTDRVETKTLCVGSTCVTEEQFLEMVNKLSNSGSGSSNTTTTTTDSTNTETTVTTPEATADTTTSSADGASTSSSVTTSSSDPTLPTSSSSSNDSSVTTTTTSEAGDTSSSTSSDTSSDSSPDNSTPAS